MVQICALLVKLWIHTSECYLSCRMLQGC